MMRRTVSVLLASQPHRSARLPATRSFVYLDSRWRTLSTSQNTGTAGFGNFRTDSQGHVTAGQDYNNRNLRNDKEKTWDPKELHNDIARKMADSDLQGDARYHTGHKIVPPAAQETVERYRSDKTVPKQTIDEHKVRMDMALGKDRAGASPYNRADSAKTPDL
jgi:hypothetical protein